MNATSCHVGRALRASVGVALLVVAALARTAAAADLPADPPARVGRISLVQGQVDAMIDAGSGEWGASLLNAPITSGSALRTQLRSHAEVRAGAVSIQINANTHLAITTLDDRILVIELQRGGIEVQPRVLAPGERIEVRADGARFTIGARGVYRFDHAPGEARFEVNVFDGVGTLAGKSAAVEVTAGRQGVMDTRTLLAASIGDARRRPFDEWAVQRDERMQLRESRYVNGEMTGAEALEGQGAWRVEPNVGAVWYPSAVALDWAPYRYGRWLWVSPWGWTWVDDAAWGFAPFHYGRWLFLGGRWGWVPGPVAARPNYAPALVGFYGRPGAAQAGWALNTGGEVVGWFPLAPGEIYRPSYAASAQYTRALNAGASATAAAGNPAVGGAAPSYRYAQTSFAATAVGRDAFGQGAIGSARAVLGPAALANAVAIDRGPAMLPPRLPSPGTSSLPATASDSAQAKEAAPQAQRPLRVQRNDGKRPRPLREAWQRRHERAAP